MCEELMGGLCQCTDLLRGIQDIVSEVVLSGKMTSSFTPSALYGVHLANLNEDKMV